MNRDKGKRNIPQAGRTAGSKPDKAAARASMPFKYTLLPLGTVVSAAVAYCGFRHETAAGMAMLLCSLYIGFFARERATVVGVIVPAYLIVLFSGGFAVPAAYVGICVAVGAGAFLFRLNRLSFALAALAATAAGALLLGPAGAALGLALIPPALVLARVYPRSSVGVSVAMTAAATAASAAVFGAVFLLLSPEYGLPEGIGGVGELLDGLRRELIDLTLKKYSAMEIGPGGAEQYVDSVIRISPGLAAAAAEALAYISNSVCGAAFRGFEIEPESFTNAPERYILSPVTGTVYFITALVCAGSSSEFGVLAVSCENIMLALSLPLAVFAVSAARRAAKKASLAFLGTAVTAAAAGAAIFAGWQGISLFAAVGGVLCIITPVRRFFNSSEGSK